jgi:hypothetical protein
MKNQNAFLDGRVVLPQRSIHLSVKSNCHTTFLRRAKPSSLSNRNAWQSDEKANSWEPPNLGPPTLASTENKQADRIPLNGSPQCCLSLERAAEEEP